MGCQLLMDALAQTALDGRTSQSCTAAAHQQSPAAPIAWWYLFSANVRLLGTLLRRSQAGSLHSHARASRATTQMTLVLIVAALCCEE